MSLILDLAVLGVLAFCIWNGKRRGFIKTFFGFFGSLIAYALTALFAKPVGTLIGGAIFPSMRDRFLDSVAQRTGEAVDRIDLTALPESCNDLLAPFGLTAESLSDRVSEVVEESGRSSAEHLSEIFIRPLADSIGIAIAAILLFVVFLVIIRVVTHVLDLISKFPGLNFSNRILGLVAGAVQGIFLAVLISALLMLAAPIFTELGLGIDPNKTILVRFFGTIPLLGSF